MTILPKGSVPVQDWPCNYPPPLNHGLGPMSGRSLGDAAGLGQFGVHEETLPPGSTSSLRHWHEREDEFVYVLSGTLTVVDGAGAHVLGPGDAAGFAAGTPDGHTLRNDTTEPATYILIGSRHADEVVHYSDVDLVLTRRDGKGRFTRRDGSPPAADERS
jgi:uncharacterized cupin superfamily protein